MKQFLGLLLVFMVGASGLWADAFSRTGNAGALSVTYSSAKPLSRGDNLVNITIVEGSKTITDAKVTFVASMPEMPGMHAMEEKAEAVLKGNAYEANIFLSMNGTWQITIYIETADGKKQRLRSSVNL
ncbi:FixH family protein [Sulfurospirillum sp. T05]|uniref:FixH family protein n=1 Tax=Sulfurospirillum tamanense TaxID=2813362 RepID=A0ABS2WP86_9BACT|nr:FixH family protein [Sulfurospirillum tamanensis]MBN2963315.1 FixH family protein [Sulfurospirillum tamanensis]